MRELSSPRVDQSARCPVRELAIRELAYPRVIQLPSVLFCSLLHKTSQSLLIFIWVATSGGCTNGTPLGITVCVSASGATGALARARAGCRRGLRSPAVGVRSGCHSQNFFLNFRRKFLLSGALSVKKINSCESAKYHTSSFQAAVRAASAG